MFEIFHKPAGRVPKINKILVITAGSPLLLVDNLLRQPQLKLCDDIPSSGFVTRPSCGPLVDCGKKWNRPQVDPLQLGNFVSTSALAVLRVQPIGD